MDYYYCIWYYYYYYYYYSIWLVGFYHPIFCETLGKLDDMTKRQID